MRLVNSYSKLGSVGFVRAWPVRILDVSSEHVLTDTLIELGRTEPIQFYGTGGREQTCCSRLCGHRQYLVVDGLPWMLLANTQRTTPHKHSYVVCECAIKVQCSGAVAHLPIKRQTTATGLPAPTLALSQKSSELHFGKRCGWNCGLSLLVVSPCSVQVKEKLRNAVLCLFDALERWYKLQTNATWRPLKTWCKNVSNRCHKASCSEGKLT